MGLFDNEAAEKTVADITIRCEICHTHALTNARHNSTRR